MKHIEGYNRSQIILFPERLDDLVLEDNPVRVIDIFIDQLNLANIGFNRAILDSSSAGHPCYSVECLLKLYVYGYFKKVRSSRRLMELCNTNIEVMWLIGRLSPDFRTIADFRATNAVAIKKVFTAFTRLCIELGLYGREVGVQDGSKFRAVNSKDNNVTRGRLEKKLEIAAKQIEKYLEELDRNDREERDTPKYTKEEIAEKIKKLKLRKEEYNKLLTMMEKEGVTQISSIDPESRLMKMGNGGFDVCFNAQIIVDPESHLIGSFAVTNECNDFGLLFPVAMKAKEELGIDVLEVPADKGYEDRADMLECLENGIIPHVPSRSGEASYEFTLDYNEAEITEELLNSKKPEDIRTCLRAGALPNVYCGKGIEVSVDELDKSDENDPRSIFTLSADGSSVTCPNGSTLPKAARLHKKGMTRFTSRSACRKCTDKCTTSSFKQVDLRDGQTVLGEKKQRRVKKVKLRLTPDKAKLLSRKSVVEHPFGTVKRWQDGSYLLVKGIKKASADMALSFLVYNLKRAINMLGTQELVEKIRELRGNIFAFS